MTLMTRRLWRGLPAMLFAWLSVFVWLLTVSVATAATKGKTGLDGGRELVWSLSDATPAPILGLAAPSYVEWSSGGIKGPIRFEMQSNYAAFIERWELALFRAGDEARKYPVRLWYGTAAELNSGVEWDGRVQTGPKLRPGETLLATLQVRDVAGNVDAVEPQPILVSRYLMSAESKRLNKLTKTRQSQLLNTATQQNIPVWGKLLTATIEAQDKDEPMFVSDLMMRKGRKGNWVLEQILPPGSHELKVQTARPIMGGFRLISAGRLFLSVEGETTMMVPVRGTGELARKPHALTVKNLTPDGMIEGRDAASLKLWDQNSEAGNLALALIDPQQEIPLFRDNRSRNLMLFKPPLRDFLWAGDPKSARVQTLKVRAHFPAIEHQMMTLPHTDIETVPFRLALRSGDTRSTYLIPFKHYILDTLQGRAKLTDAGRATIRAEVAQFPDTIVEAVYEVRQSLAGLSRRPASEIITVKGSGEALNVTFAGQGASEPDPSEGQQGWVARNFGWLLGW